MLLDFGDLDDDRSRSFPLGGLCVATRCGDTWRPKSRLPRPLCILQRNDEDCDDDDDVLPNVESMCSRDDPPNFMGPIVTIVAVFVVFYLNYGLSNLEHFLLCYQISTEVTWMEHSHLSRFSPR